VSEIYKVRASSWAGLFDCAFKWEGVHLLGMNKPSGLRAQLGTALHASTAVYDKSLIENNGVSVDDAAGVLVDQLHHPDREVDYNQDDLSLKDAEFIGLKLHTKYCGEISPHHEFLAVEMETKPFDIDCGGGIIVRLTGTMDRARISKSDKGTGITDLKSGVRAVEKGKAKTKGHAAQVGTYELLYEHSTDDRVTAPAEIIGLKTSGNPEIAKGEITNGRPLMVGTDEHPGLIQFAAEMFKTGLFPPNPSSHLCAEKYCVRWQSCPYKND
jgi:hypothetical protein